MFTGSPDSGTEITKSRRRIQEENVASEDRLRELEEKYEDYKVYDNRGERIGKVDDLFVDETDREEYIGVKMGLLGLKSTLIPMDIVRVNEGERTIEVSESEGPRKRRPELRRRRGHHPRLRGPHPQPLRPRIRRNLPSRWLRCILGRRRLRGQGARAARLRSGRRYRRLRSFFRRPRVWGTPGLDRKWRRPQRHNRVRGRVL